MSSGTEFKFVGQAMERVTLVFGVILITWAIFVSLISQSESITSMIPAFFGVPIALLGFLSMQRPKKQKIYMHIAVFFGLLVFLGGLDFLRSMSTENGAFSNPWADISKIFMLISGGLFCVLCIKSFKHVRRLRELETLEETR